MIHYFYLIKSNQCLLAHDKMFIYHFLKCCPGCSDSENLHSSILRHCLEAEVGPTGGALVVVVNVVDSCHVLLIHVVCCWLSLSMLLTVSVNVVALLTSFRLSF